MKVSNIKKVRKEKSELVSNHVKKKLWPCAAKGERRHPVQCLYLGTRRQTRGLNERITGAGIKIFGKSLHGLRRTEIDTGN